MKSKNMSILLFIVVFTGVALLDSGQVWAACYNPPLEDEICLTDCYCSEAEKAENLCFTIWGYTVTVYHPTDPNPFVPGDFPDGEWPLLDPGGCLDFWYRACVTDAVDCKGKTWNYWVQKMTACDTVVDFICDTDPPGAQLLLPGQVVPKCTDFTADTGENLLKLNPTLPCGEGNEVFFHLYVDPDTPTSLCNDTAVVTKKGCGGDYLLGPGCGSLVYTEELEFCKGKIVVTRNPCTGAPECVEINGKQAEPCYPHICFDYPDDPYCLDLVELGKEAGPAATGCVLDCDPWIYGYGTEYWCEDTTAPLNPCP